MRKWPAFFHELGYEVAAFGKVSHYKHTGDYGFDHFAHDSFHDHAGIPAAVEFLKRRATAPRRSRSACSSAATGRTSRGPRTSGATTRPRSRSRPAAWTRRRRARARARYAAAVTKADDDLGTILDAARATLGERTLFLFSSDHGAQWPFGKWNCYDAGIRVPLIVAWPGVVKPGTRTDAMVSWVDLLPTLLEAAGGEAPADIDGRSSSPCSAARRPGIATASSPPTAATGR